MRCITPPDTKSVYKIKKAFTLAETLVTLVIIGLIVAFGIPALIQSVEKIQFQSALKKEISVVSQAAMYISNDYGGSLASIYGNSGNWANDQNALMQAFASKLNTVKTCNSGVSGCWVPTVLTLHKDVSDSSDTDTYAKLVLNDGTVLQFMNFQSSCTTSRGIGAFAKKGCGTILIDVNGNKGPNVIGIDIYDVEISANGIYPGGLIDGPYEGQCSVSTTDPRGGYGCAANVMLGLDYSYY